MRRPADRSQPSQPDRLGPRADELPRRLFLRGPSGRLVMVAGTQLLAVGDRAPDRERWHEVEIWELPDRRFALKILRRLRGQGEPEQVAEALLPHVDAVVAALRGHQPGPAFDESWRALLARILPDGEGAP